MPKSGSSQETIASLYSHPRSRRLHSSDFPEGNSVGARNASVKLFHTEGTNLNQTWNSTRAGRSRVLHIPLRLESCLRGNDLQTYFPSAYTRSVPRVKLDSSSCHRTDDVLLPEGSEETEVLHPQTPVCLSASLTSKAKTEVEVLISGKSNRPSHIRRMPERQRITQTETPKQVLVLS